MRTRSWGWTVFATGFVSQCALAHVSLEEYVRQAVAMSVDATNIDISFQFSFPSSLSHQERKRMDTDGDGVLRKKDREAYLAEVTEQASKALKLIVDGQALALIPLAEPVLDLQGAEGVEAHPHELRLEFFARIPATFGVDSRLTLDSGLWADLPMMVSISAQGEDGIRLRVSETQGLLHPSAGGAMFRLMEARCTRWNNSGVKRARK